jgi:hypothetical protein
MGVIRPFPGERALAWLYTGPVGHLWSVVADVVVFVLGWRRRSRLSEARDGR